MQNTKLFLILKSLSTPELKELGKFIQSPFHNTNKTLFKFYNLLKKKHPDFASRTLELEKIHRKLFPSKPYNPAVMRNLISEMIKIIEEYLALLNFRKDIIDHKIHLLKQLRSRNIEKLFEKSMEESLEFLENSKIRDDSYYYNKYILESLKRSFYESKVPVGRSSKIYSMLPEEVEYLKISFFMTILKDFFSIYNFQGNLNLEYRYKFLDEIMDYISKEEEYKNIPLIYILHTFLSLVLKGENENVLPELKETIDKNREIMSNDDYRSFYVELYNYYKNKQFIGDKKAGLKSFELIREMLEKDILLQPGENMTAHTYINICASAIRVNNLKWAEDFSNKYRNRLLPQHQSNAYIYNFAGIHYIQAVQSNDKKEKEKEFGKALEYLSKVKSEDFFYMIRIKNMLIRINYELGNVDDALNLTVNYRQYLSKNKLIPQDLHERYSNFADFVLKLIKLRMNKDYMPISQIKKELIKKSNTTELKGWLTNKLNELHSESSRRSKVSV